MSQGFAANGNIIITGKVDSGNSSSTPLNSGATFTGTSLDVSAYPTIIVSYYSDEASSVYVEFSSDNVNWDYSEQVDVLANTQKTIPALVRYKYFRVKVTNTSDSNQTVLRLQTLLGGQDTQATKIIDSDGSEFGTSENPIHVTTPQTQGISTFQQQYDQTDLLNLMLIELQQINKTLKKIYQ